MLLMGDLNVGSELELSALAVGKVWGSLEKRPFLYLNRSFTEQLSDRLPKSLFLSR